MGKTESYLSGRVCYNSEEFSLKSLFNLYLRNYLHLQSRYQYYNHENDTIKINFIFLKKQGRYV